MYEVRTIQRAPVDTPSTIWSPSIALDTPRASCTHRWTRQTGDRSRFAREV